MARKSKIQRNLDELEKELDDPELSEDFRQDVKEIIDEMRRMDKMCDMMSSRKRRQEEDTAKPRKSHVEKLLFCRHIFNVVKPKAKAKKCLLELDEGYEPFIKIFYRR